MKNYSLILLSLFCLLSCKKTTNNPNDPSNGNGNGSGQPTSTLAKIQHTNKWQIDYNLKINQQVGSHTNTVSKMKLGDSEYHYKVWSSGYQTLGSVCKFNGNDWENCQNVGYSATMAYTNSLINVVYLEYVSKTKKSTLSSFIFDKQTQTWTNYEQDLGDHLASDYKITASGNDFYLITQFNLKTPIDIWKWNHQTKKWDLTINDFAQANNWASYSVSEGLDNEFIIRAYDERETYKVSFYVYRNGQIQLLYKTNTYTQVSPQVVCGVYPFNGKYLFIDGNIGYITAASKIEPLHNELSGGNIFSQIVGDKIFLMNGTRPLDTYAISDIQVFDTKTSKLHQLSLEVNSTVLKDRIGGQQLPQSWKFDVKGNQIILLANTSQGVSGVSGTIVADVALLTYDINW